MPGQSFRASDFSSDGQVIVAVAARNRLSGKLHPIFFHPFIMENPIQWNENYSYLRPFINLLTT